MYTYIANHVIHAYLTRALIVMFQVESHQVVIDIIVPAIYTSRISYMASIIIGTIIMVVVS